jgi:hypothetical protein
MAIFSKKDGGKGKMTAKPMAKSSSSAPKAEVRVMKSKLTATPKTVKVMKSKLTATPRATATIQKSMVDSKGNVTKSPMKEMKMKSISAKEFYK